MKLIPLNYNRIPEILAENPEEYEKMYMSIARKALKTEGGICLNAARFPNEIQEKLAEKYLLSNDMFIKTADELAQKTKTKVAVIPNFIAGNFVEMRILEGLSFWGMYAKNKQGRIIYNVISDNISEHANNSAVENFINQVKDFIKNR